MSYAPNPVRPGLAAIAAVLALSSTPSFAQDASPAPAMVTPPPAEPAPATVAPAAEAPAPAVAPMAQSSAAPSTSGVVTVPTRPGGIATGLDAAPATPAAASEPVTEPVSRPVVRTAAAPRANPAPAPREAAPAAPIAARRAAPVAPPTAQAVDTAPPPIAPVAEAPAVTPEPTPAPTPRAAQVDADNDLLPIAGAAGVAILLIGGGVYAMRRRRDEDEEELLLADTVETPAEPVPAVAAAPLSMADTTPAPAPTMDAPVTAVPAGFDISRFGPHTQAAYRGPTPDNPSLSLKRRLRVASFLDNRERMAAEGGQPATPTSAAPAAPQPAAAPRQPGHVTTRIKVPPRPGFRPAWQS
ncbi:hypothetical protein ACFOHO_02085 [Rhizorhabdus histidinilytica]|uniref:LPXTG cell wall anchor domain-containing protein n=1 Tax=Rhizorhabdus histidinilytica TaxID=439228 RepID=A0A1T5BY77_9SPHN|nr:hypothetical protein [Rhizorhabdus histidinilytica]SKB52332.1 hypothetical protein SAMN06295920_103401 [Rhizorhabdus histidinilytica]